MTDPYDEWFANNMHVLQEYGSGYIAIHHTKGVRAFGATSAEFKQALEKLDPNEGPDLLTTHTDVYLSSPPLPFFSGALPTFEGPQAPELAIPDAKQTRDLNMSERCARLDQFIAEGRLVRGKWAETIDGKEYACLLAALSPEAGRFFSRASCPAEVMPAWLAHLTVWMNDAGTEEQWPTVIRHYASLAKRWHVLSPEDWDTLENTLKVEILKLCLGHAGPASEYGEKAISLYERRMAKEQIDPEEWLNLRVETSYFTRKNSGPPWRAAFAVYYATRFDDGCRLSIYGAGSLASMARHTCGDNLPVDTLIFMILDELEKAISGKSCGPYCCGVFPDE
jgi:hypothetical protein